MKERLLALEIAMGYFWSEPFLNRRWVFCMNMMEGDFRAEGKWTKAQIEMIICSNNQYLFHGY
jgi:hypothetical protein